MRGPPGWNCIILLTYFLTVSTNAAGFGDIYCGDQNCYDVLQVTRDDDKNALRKAYHKLARSHHPDRQKTREAKEKADEVFRRINTAYEILSDPEQRQEYDYMLDNPDEMYLNYYRYYRRHYAAKVDVRLVIMGIILLLSTIQYIGQWTSYNHALSYLVRDPKHRAMARDIAQADGLLNSRRLIEGGKRLNREEIKAREEAILRTIISQQVDLRGDCGKPTLRRVLLVRILVFPYTVFSYFNWAIKWVWSYWLLRRPYDSNAQEYLTRRRLNMRQDQWDSIKDKEKQMFLKKKLWITANYKTHQLQQEEELRVQTAANSQQKRYRRYIKQAGPQPIDLDF